MGLLSHKIGRDEVNPGDHIYTYRSLFTYSHHGIYVGGGKVVHFSPEQNPNSSTSAFFSSSHDSNSRSVASCLAYPDCGFRQPNSNVVLSCLDCFLRGGSLYRFSYGERASLFLAKRGGTSTIAVSDSPVNVIHRAMYLLQNGFGNYDMFRNNCEDFAMYCKTGLLVTENQGGGRSGQASSVVAAPLAAIVSTSVKLLIPNPVAAATISTGMYYMGRYATDIGVRTDVIKVPVEDLALNYGWETNHH